MPESPMITGSAICAGFRARKLMEQAAEDEKVVRILGCPTIVKRGRLELAAMRARKAITQAWRGTPAAHAGDVKA